MNTTIFFYFLVSLSFVIIRCNPIIGTTIVPHIYALRVGPVTPKNKRNCPKLVYSVNNLSLSDHSKWNQPNQACQLPNPVNKPYCKTSILTSSRSTARSTWRPCSLVSVEFPLIRFTHNSVEKKHFLLVLDKRTYASSSRGPKPPTTFKLWRSRHPQWPLPRKSRHVALF